MVESQASLEESEKPGVRENKLNELSGTEWIKFTKSLFVHRPKPRGDQKIRHPASFPESLVREFILFFSKKGHLVVYLFLGTGSTLVAPFDAALAGVRFAMAEIYTETSRTRAADVLN